MLKRMSDCHLHALPAFSLAGLRLVPAHHCFSRGVPRGPGIGYGCLCVGSVIHVPSHSRLHTGQVVVPSLRPVGWLLPGQSGVTF